MESVSLRPQWPQVGDLIEPLKNLAKTLFPSPQPRHAAYELLSLNHRVMKDVGLHRPEAQAEFFAPKKTG